MTEVHAAQVNILVAYTALDVDPGTQVEHMTELVQAMSQSGALFAAGCTPVRADLVAVSVPDPTVAALSSDVDVWAELVALLLEADKDGASRARVIEDLRRMIAMREVGRALEAHLANHGLTCPICKDVRPSLVSVEEGIGRLYARRVCETCTVEFLEEYRLAGLDLDVQKTEIEVDYVERGPEPPEV